MRTGFKAAVAVAMAGAAAAAAVGLAGPAGAAPAAAHGPAVIKGTEHIQGMTTSGTATVYPVIAYGVFTAGGTDHEVNSNTDTFVLPGGTFRVKHSNGTGPQTFNPKTCLFMATIHGTYSLSGGTGKYKGISGNGKYVASILGIAARAKSGACNMSAAPVSWQQVIDASGPVKLP
jgi:hypothetical protein